MLIHQIAIDNFKSFAEKTVIPFEGGFTTISGPNGSGKSNIIDSILFCLGLSTSRTMRAEKLSDLVNNLSRRKEAIVTITFRKTQEDMEREAHQMALGLDVLPVDAEQSPDTEADSESPVASESATVEDAEPLTSESQVLTSVKEISATELGPNSEFVQVGRRIKGNASGYTSTYYLNAKPTTLTEIHDYLGNFNVSPGTYNVMMQGDVAGIVNMSPMERRKIIDEIAGVAEFDRKIDQAQRELEATGANIERNSILLNEIQVRLEQLAAERDHALKYQKLRDEKIRYEGLLLSAKYLDVKKAIAATVQNLVDARKQKELVQTTIQALIADIAVTHEQLLDLSSQVKKKGEDQQIALKKQIEGLKGHIARKEDAIRSIDEKTGDNQRRVEQMRQEIARMQENTEGIDAEIANFAHQLKELQALYNTEVKEAQRLEQQFDSLTGSSGELSVKRNDVRRRLSEAEDSFSSLNRKKLDSEAEIKRYQYEMDLRLRSNKDSSEKLETLTAQKTVLDREANDAQLEKDAFEAQLRQLQLDYSQARVNLNQFQAKHTELHREYVQLEARQRAYEEVNFTRAVDTILRADLPGVHGTVAQLGDVNSDYGLAMEIALGGRIQNIVVDDDQVASDGIRLLQENRAGRATFLPLNKIQGARSLPPLPNEPGVIDYAFNLIDCEPQYDDVFAYALGDTLIVENAQAARRLLRRYRMVTLDGSLMEKSGAMTGGSQPNRGKGGGYFGGNQIEQELQELAKRLEKAEADKEQGQKKLTMLEVKMEGVKGDYAQLMQRYSRVSAELDGVNRQVAEIQTSQAGLVDVSDLTAQVKTLESELSGMEAQIAVGQSTIGELEKELAGIESQLPSDKIDELREQMKEVKFQMEYYDSQMRNVQTDIKSKEMEKNYQQVGIQDCKQRIEQAEQNSAGIAKERVAALEEIELTMVQIRDLDAQTTELDEELKKLQEERDRVQALLIEQEKQKNIQERNAVQLEEQINAFQTRKRELDPQLQRLVVDLNQAGIEPTSIEADKLPSEEDVQQNIARLTKRMESMEPVNMLAIDEYARVEERRNELGEKIETLNQERETIGVKIASYHELKRASFMKAYESVDNGFRTIFADLSDGSGQLMLTNPDSPFEGGLTIHAQPRGKKMLRIEGLSGGEKSLTSLAFVFAIQRYMPAPFYALDEVDQNLDGINAEKLAHMVQRESQRAQFIVVSLRKPMIESSERTIGVTQRQNGITKVTGIKHREEGESLPPSHGPLKPKKSRVVKKKATGDAAEPAESAEKPTAEGDSVAAAS
jgi:chromosome segregation protein